MKINPEARYCQICGIPLDIAYTNLKEGQNEEYCDYCLKNGVKLYDFSMDYLLYLWGLFPEEYNKEVGTDYTSTELREVLSKRLPEIKRWKQKINTAHMQYELIIKVQEYINRHLFDDLDSGKLSQVAGMSKFHFRRLFKAVSGENLGKYILRLRLEYIAFKIISTDTSVPELLSQISYQNKHTLSRAFKSYFNCSIPEFRKKHSHGCPEGKNPVRVELSIEKVPGMRIAYLKLERTNNLSHSFSVLWKEILQFSERYELASKGCKYVSLTLDYPLITLEEHSRFMVGVTLPPSFKVPKGFGVYEIPSGEYAIFRFKGLYHELNRAYRHIYLDWLPTSDYTLREPFTFETYINTPEKTPVSELITDIYIPIVKKRKMNYKDKAIHCVKDTILPMQRKQFEECGRCLDEQYKRYGNTEWLFAKTIEKGHIYEIGYPACVCPDVRSGKVKDVSHCECSRQSILYIIGNLLPDKNINVEIIETVLGGAEKCRFKVTVE